MPTDPKDNKDTIGSNNISAIKSNIQSGKNEDRIVSKGEVFDTFVMQTGLYNQDNADDQSKSRGNAAEDLAAFHGRPPEANKAEEIRAFVNGELGKEINPQKLKIGNNQIQFVGAGPVINSNNRIR